MDFSEALTRLKSGQRVARNGWNAGGQWVGMQVPDDHSKMRRPYFFLRPVDGAYVPWVPTQSDLFADDWVADALPPRVTRETEDHYPNQQRLHDLLLDECGYEDGAEVFADGSAYNDLAQERVDAIMKFIKLAKGHSLPNKLLPH